MSVPEVLGYIMSMMQQLGVMPYIQAGILALVGIAVITALYKALNRQ